ncbi:restriction endonuclease S subunit [Belliella baltica DSM 15883]|uniref:Restriction endonuclease S subunit n=1 Tax=Belliella baltica (strain DSM 15883 / CIP 108006 / LMG 21964 / BA134) TaxID=866536 RepID=I3ZA88_BELBD|nr:restriction endonuclease subunit S [Belliella baltica]AFL86156.1 restriction endonuclease S subunit [Belliella baltica DSM 15883]
MMEEKLPKGWRSKSLQNVLSFVIGGDWGKDPNDISEEDYVQVAVIRGSEIKNWRKDKGSTASIRVIKQNSLEKRNLIEGDILIEISGGGPDQPVGRVILIDEDTLSQNSNLPKIGTNFLRLLRANQKLINAPFLNYYLTFFYLSGKVIEYQGGSNNLRNLKYKEFEKIQIPHPPLTEQHRIVAKLDVLFGHLDSLREKLDRIPALLKNFRQQVLTQAVTGELTKEWREEEKIENKNGPIPIPESWSFRQLKELSISLKYGSSSKSLNLGDVPVLRMGNIQEGEIDWSDLKYSSDQIEIGKYKLTAGDLLFNRTNSPELVGKTAIFRGDREAVFAGYLIQVKPKDSINSEFLNFVLNSNYAKKWCWEVKTDGVSQSNINAKKLGDFIVPFPSLDEQLEIVSKVNSLFEISKRIESQYHSLKTKIDQLPQAILAKAFLGELVSQEVKEYVVEKIEGLMAAEGEEGYGIE